jgi:hypothetical protein
MKRTFVAALGAVLLVTAVACRPTNPPRTTTTFGSPTTVNTLPPGTGDCDRACLTAALDQYVAALLAHDPSRLPLAPNVKFTEDNVIKRVGEGLWTTATRARPYKQDVIDVRSGVAGRHAVLEEGTQPVLFVLRLKLVNRQITEIETLATRGNGDQNAIFSPNNLRSATPAMYGPPPGRLNSRAEMITISDSYAQGLRVGSLASPTIPFASSAYRLENGVRMAGAGGLLPMRSSVPRPNPQLTYRVVGVDEELGISWLALNFRRQGIGSLFVWEMFKIADGRIYAVEAFMKVAATGPVW